MRHDRITIFNHIASNELEDIDLFEDLLEYHYEKFRYFYTLLENINLNKIENIKCEETKRSLRLYITPLENKYLKDIEDKLNRQIGKYVYHNFFDLSIGIIENQIEVALSTDLMSEDLIYAN